MFKRIILVQIDSILGYPPTVSLIHELVGCGCDVTVLTSLVNNQLEEVLPDSVKLVKIGVDYSYKTSPVKKLLNLFEIRRNLWKYIDGHYASAANRSFVEVETRLRELFAELKPGVGVPGKVTDIIGALLGDSGVYHFCDTSTSGRTSHRGSADNT